MAYKNVNVDISITPISSYNDLNNKPSINGVELDGNLSSEELDIKVDTTDIENSISTIKSDLDDLGDQVSVIESKIPAESSDSNQLTDKLYLHNNFYTKTQVDQTVELKVNRNELNDYATKQQLETKQDKLTAGDNITIENGIISSTGTSSEVPNNVYTTDNLIAGKNVTLTEVPPAGGIDEHTLACWHFDSDLVDSVASSTLAGGTFIGSYYKFGPGGASVSKSTVYKFPDISKAYACTIDFWYKKSTTTSFEIGFLNSLTSGNNYGWSFRLSPSDNTILFGSRTPVGISWTTQRSIPYTFGNDFIHVVCQRLNVNKCQLFINGQLLLEGEPDGTLEYQSITLAGAAYVDELRISKVARYAEDFTPPTEPYTLATGPSKTAVNATIPTKTSELENDSSFLTELPTNLVNTDEEQTITSLKHFQGGIDLPINSEFMVANGTTVFKHNGSRLLMGATTDLLTIRSIGTPKINRDGTDYENIDSGNISEFVNTNNSSDYELPTASTTTLGGVKVDGTTITIDGNGVISSTVTSSGENSIGGPASWGNITGDISSQSDLQEELNKKVNGVGITSVIRLTQDEYDSLQSIDENAQYIIVGETSTQGGDYISTSSVVTSLDENVTDDQIPSAKLVYDLFMSVEQQLSEI